MSEPGLFVRMLGTFSVEVNGKQIDDDSNRSRKVWLLLAYMIYHRSRPLSQEELIALLNGAEGDSSNPSNALRAVLHRVRGLLNQLGDSAGHGLILRKNGSYAWNTHLPLRLDAEEFDALCGAAAAAEDGEVRLSLYRQALALYRGDFLTKLSSAPWVVPICAYYRGLYFNAVREVLALWEDGQNHKEAAELCKAALRIDPCSEELYRRLMRSLLELGDPEGVVAAYEEMSELFRSEFGVMPPEDIRSLYYEAASTVNDKAIPFDLLQAQLREPETASGALMCDYDFFKVLYHSAARMVIRSGDAVHIGLISMTGRNGSPLSSRSLDTAMENLRQQIRVCLRRGDAAARCSVSQFVLMLPRANYENSCKVCERIVKAFFRQYPHSPAELRYAVQPLEANV